MHRTILLCFCLAAMALNAALAQDTTWQQVLGGWVDDVYYENLFLGGAYYTRICLDDIDGDGDHDMFYGGGGCGTLVYFENVGDPQQHSFELRYEEYPVFRHPTRYGGIANIDFADLDNDGDLDASFDYEIDRGGLIFVNEGSPQEPEFDRYPYGPQGGQGNSTFADIDADGDYDYFSGQGARNTQLYFAENIGSPESYLFEFRTYHYQDLNFGIPFNFDMGDIDQDGDYDIIVCKHGGNVAYYENIGSPTDPNFTLLTNDLLPERDTTDWLETPELADFDSDGDLDLFLAGAYAHLFYFENTGSSEEPRFVQRFDTTYFYVLPYNAGAWLGNAVDINGDGHDDLAPGRSIFVNESSNGQIRFSRVDNVLPFILGSFADIDADGDYDYIIPGGTYAVRYFENIGDYSWPEWGSIRNLFPSDGRLNYIWSVTTGDLDNDGDQDLLVGHQNGNPLSYYRNDGDSVTYDFTYAGELSLPQWEFHSAFDALLGDIDNDLDLDLLIGDTRYDEHYQIRLMFYRNDGTPEQPSWTFVTDDFQNASSEHRNSSIAPCLADVDNDGDGDLVLTNNGIGMQLFLNPLDPTDIGEKGQDAFANLPNPIVLSCHPNPFNSTVRISLYLARPSDIDLSVYNLLGQRVASIFRGLKPQGVHSLNWEPVNLAAGIYFLRVSAGQHTRSIKILYLK